MAVAPCYKLFVLFKKFTLLGMLALLTMLTMLSLLPPLTLLSLLKHCVHSGIYAYIQTVYCNFCLTDPEISKGAITQ